MFGKENRSNEFEEKVKKIMDTLYKTAFNLTRNNHDAEDLLQDAVFRAYRSYGSSGEVKNFKAWMTAILRNAYINRYRKKKREPAEVQFVEGETENFTAADFAAREDAGGEEFSEAVRSAIDALPEKLRTAVILFYVDRFTYREIAEITGVPRGTVMSRLYNARRLLKKELSGEFAGLPG